MKTVDAVIDEKGEIKLLEPVQLSAGQRRLITVIGEPGSNDVRKLRGFVKYQGLPKTLEEMEEAISEGAQLSDRH